MCKMDKKCLNCKFWEDDWVESDDVRVCYKKEEKDGKMIRTHKNRSCDDWKERVYGYVK